jgi:hypothetical protein
MGVVMRHHPITVRTPGKVMRLMAQTQATSSLGIRIPFTRTIKLELLAGCVIGPRGEVENFLQPLEPYLDA